ncbi:hypothetical protein Ga0074812_11493 [Parafrankia irregularis]|uniref:Uncharacterized protein n=1 Tax=Parafrankia irregularis TaxID=795642 RepID=A0A0S4QRW8_9ACTN|nr:hypothetical protein Ga0074812_11493 [Parafrankia irregularis]
MRAPSPPPAYGACTTGMGRVGDVTEGATRINAGREPGDHIRPNVIRITPSTQAYTLPSVVPAWAGDGWSRSEPLPPPARSIAAPSANLIIIARPVEPHTEVVGVDMSFRSWRNHVTESCLVGHGCLERLRW